MPDRILVKLRRILLPLLFCGSVALAAAQAPASVAGMVAKFTLIDALHRTLTVDRWLRADGSFQDLSVIVADSNVNRAAALITGTYDYSASGAVGELAFHPATSDSLPSKIDLTFADPGAGTLTGAFTGFGTNGAVFSLRLEASSAGVMNVSCRTMVTPGAPAIAGFVVNSPQKRFVLVRAVGPSLAQFGVDSPLADPYLEVHGGGAPNRRYVRSSAMDFVGDEVGMAQLSRLAGAFPLTAGAGDSLAVLELPPGAHTVVVGSASGTTTGPAMIEVYFLP